MTTKQELLTLLADPEIARVLHQFSDLDRSTKSQHHTLGKLHNQASPGPHKHDGKDSVVLTSGTLAVDPVATPVATTSGTTVKNIQSVTVPVVKGVRYLLLWTCFDAFTSVAGDRYTFQAKYDGAISVTSTPITINFPSTTVASTPVPPVIDSWVADTTGNVTFSIQMFRVSGTGTLTVNPGMLYVQQLAPSLNLVTTTSGGSGSSAQDVRATTKIVQSAYSANSSTNPKPVTLPSTPSSSNKLLLCSAHSAAIGISGISQTNVTWAAVGGTSGGAPVAEVWVGTPTGVPGTTVTVTYSSASASFNTVFVAEITGNTLTLDQQVASVAGLPSTAAGGPSITPTKGALVVFVGTKASGTPNFSAGYILADPWGINVAPESAHGIADTGTIGVGLMISNTGQAVKSVMGNVTQNTSTKTFYAVSFV